MNHSDEDLQEQSGPGDGVDAQAYQKVFEALKQEPEYMLPVYFADRLVNIIESKERAKETSRDNLWFGLGLFSFVMGLVVAFGLAGIKWSVGAFRFFAGYPGLVIFGFAFVLLLNWIDLKIIRKIQAF